MAVAAGRLAITASVWKPGSQIGKVSIREDGVGSSPQQEGRHIAQQVESGGYRVEGSPARMGLTQRNVLDEPSDRRPATSAPVGRLIGQTDGSGKTWAGQHQGPAQKQGCCHAGQPKKPPRSHHSYQSRSQRLGRLVNRGVHENDPGRPAAVTQGPSERDGTSPVMCNCYHRSSHPEFIGDCAEILDPLFQAANCPRPFRETHVELIDCDHPHARRCLSDDVTPQVRPGGVAVNAKQRRRRVLDLIVEKVPGSGHA